MKTIQILSVSLLGLALISCQEKASKLVPSNAVVAKDTTYIAAIEDNRIGLC